MNRIFFLGGVIAFLFVSSTWSETPPAPTEAITATANGFHDALGRGDSAAALNLLAPDAVILESGSAQTREEYAREHLAEDIAFVNKRAALPGLRLHPSRWEPSTGVT